MILLRWLWFITSLMACFSIAMATGDWFLMLLSIPLFDFFISRFFNWDILLPKINIRIPLLLNLIIWIIISGWMLRTFFVDSMAILNTGMQPTLSRGDHVLISKIHYGARMPITPINFPLSHQYLPFSRCKRSYSSKIELKYRRFEGLTNIKSGDLIAYNFPEGDSAICGVETMSYYALKRLKESKGEQIRKDFLHYRPVDRREIEAARCVGRPGDTVALLDRVISVNGELFNHGSIRFDYLVEVDNEHLSRNMLHQLGLEQSDITIFPGLGYALPLFPDQVSGLASRPPVKSVSPYNISEGRGNRQIFPHHPGYKWNRDNFGPILVPKKGMTIQLTPQNLPFYERIISVYEKSVLEVDNGVIFVNGLPVNEYTVQQNYFFVVGDNRHHARDSRHWGFLPEDHIIGKPFFIWLSLRNDAVKGFNINWNRFFKKPK